jgi:hypothetical protein
MPRFLHRLFARDRRRTASGRRAPPQVEPLEVRANPVALSFVPMSVVAVNPQPLPPTALVQFNPLPVLSDIPSASQTVQTPIQIQGTFKQTLLPTSIPVPPGPPITFGTLTMTYNLTGTVTETVTSTGAYSATFTLTGQVTEVLQPPGLVGQPAWSITTMISEKGIVSEPTLASADFKEQISLVQTEKPVTATTGVTPWVVRSTVLSSGTFYLNTVSPAPITPFNATDQITESLTPVTPLASLPPLPTLISAASTETGSVMESVYPPGPIVVPTVTGTTQYQEKLSETIIPPSGGTQTLTEAFDTSGAFQQTERGVRHVRRLPGDREFAGARPVGGRGLTAPPGAVEFTADGRG